MEAMLKGRARSEGADTLSETLYFRLHIIQPYTARLLARERVRALTCYEIAERSGLSAQTVKRVSNADNWLNVTVGTMMRFFAGCGLEINHLRYEREMMRNTNNFRDARHLRRVLNHSLNPPHVWKFYERLLEKQQGAQNSACTPALLHAESAT